MDRLAEQFEASRARLRAVAYRMLGSPTEADDALQEAWLRLSRSDPAAIDNLGGWLTTVVARVCLDMLRSRRSRREDALDEAAAETLETRGEGAEPENEALLADAVGPALLLVLEKLAPAERVAFVLHDLFGVSFEEIAPIVGRSEAAARQLASRARRRVRGLGQDYAAPSDVSRQRAVVAAFQAASRRGDFAALLEVLDPEVVVRADPAAVQMGGMITLVRGASAVAQTFASLRAGATRPALIDGVPGLVWAQGGVPRVVFVFAYRDDRVAGIELVADPERIAGMEVVLG